MKIKEEQMLMEATKAMSELKIECFATAISIAEIRKATTESAEIRDSELKKIVSYTEEETKVMFQIKGKEVSAESVKSKSPELYESLDKKTKLWAQKMAEIGETESSLILPGIDLTKLEGLGLKNWQVEALLPVAITLE